MASKDVLLKQLHNVSTDRIPFAPFLTYWWENNRNQTVEHLGEVGFIRSTGCDILMRGHYDRMSHDKYENLFTFKEQYETVKTEEIIKDKYKYFVYHTPIGDLTDTYTYSPGGDTWFLTSHPVKEESDFEILRYIIRDMIVEPDDAYKVELAQNPDTLYLPLVTPLSKTGFQSMIEHWVGTEAMAEFWMDCPEEIDKTLEDMYKLSEIGAKISADSDAEAFLSWEDSSTTNVSPSWYRDFIAPEIDNWCSILHDKGKLYVQHACGHLKALGPEIAKTQIDALESITSPPTGNTDIVELSKVLPNRITLIGGLEPTFMVNASDSDVSDKLDELLFNLSGRSVILANADSCPPQVDVNRFGYISEQLFNRFGLVPPNISKF